MSVRIGISGWRYEPWRGAFYPPKLPQREELAFASHALRTIELNGSFYSLQRPESYARWREETPEDFVFSVKGSRFITHLKQLREIEVPLANFLASGVLALEQKLGPFLWQFPERFQLDLPRMEAFFRLLPRDTAQAVELARRHDARLEGRSFLEPRTAQRLRHAVEVRSKSFEDPRFVALLRAHGIAMVVADTAGRWPCLEDITAGFVYVRLHGDEELYASGYSDAALARWAERIRAWSEGSQPPDARCASSAAPRPRKRRDVFVYFDNDIKVHAPFDAAALARLLGAGRPGDPELPRHPPRRRLRPEKRKSPWEGLRGP